MQHTTAFDRKQDAEKLKKDLDDSARRQGVAVTHVVTPQQYNGQVYYTIRVYDLYGEYLLTV